MGILEEEENQQQSTTTVTKDEAKAVATASSSGKTGYERPLFVEDVVRWNDDRMMGGGGEKLEVRYHDKDNVLKVTNGLCQDIFFRAEDVNRPGFEKIPDFSDPVAEEPKKEQKAQKVDLKKPLDSKDYNRTYLLNPDEKEEEKKKPNRRKPSRSSRSGSRRRGKPGRKPRRRKR